MPSHLVASGTEWLNETVAAQGEQTEDAGSQPRHTQAQSRFDYLIDQIFARQNAPLARRFVAWAETQPQMADRIEPFLREIASPSNLPDLTPRSEEEQWAYLESFLRNALGTPEHLINDALEALWDPTVAEAAARATMSPVQLARAQEIDAHIAERQRDQAKQDITKYERMMREAPQEYWRPENQRAYREALEISLAPPPEMPVPYSEEIAAGEFGATLPGAAPAAPPSAPAAPSAGRVAA